MANDDAALKCPSSIRNRRDAVQLWKYLLVVKQTAFHWEDDPSDLSNDDGTPVFSDDEAADIRRLYAEVAELNDDWCYGAACSLSKLTFLVGPEVLTEIPLRASNQFDRCGNRDEALQVLGRILRRGRSPTTRFLANEGRALTRAEQQPALKQVLSKRDTQGVVVPDERLGKYHEICDVFLDAIRERVGDDTADAMLIALANVVPATPLRLARTSRR